MLLSLSNGINIIAVMIITLLFVHTQACGNIIGRPLFVCVLKAIFWICVDCTGVQYKNKQKSLVRRWKKLMGLIFNLLFYFTTPWSGPRRKQIKCLFKWWSTWQSVHLKTGAAEAQPCSLLRERGEKLLRVDWSKTLDQTPPLVLMRWLQTTSIMDALVHKHTWWSAFILRGSQRCSLVICRFERGETPRRSIFAKLRVDQSRPKFFFTHTRTLSHYSSVIYYYYCFYYYFLLSFYHSAVCPYWRLVWE